MRRRSSPCVIGMTACFYGTVNLFAATVSADRYLDRPLPSDLKIETEWAPPGMGSGPNVPFHGVRVANIPQCIQLLQQLSGKRIVKPSPLAAELVNELRTQDEPRRGSFWGIDGQKSVRGLFNRLCLSIGVVPHYNPARDEVVLEMNWRRQDPRTGADLVSLLETTAPVAWEKLSLGLANIVGGRGEVLDSWRIAFDALLSKPGNFDTAGELRIHHDEHAVASLGDFPVMNLLSRKMRDSSGSEELLVLNTQAQMTNKSAPPDLAYYLFDQSGRFLRGGIYSMGEGSVGALGKAKLDSAGAVTIDVGWGSFGLNPDHAHFALENGDMIFKGATTSDGQVMPAAESSVATNDQKRQPPHVPVPGQDPALILKPNESHPPVEPAPAAKPVHWHGAMGVLKMSVTGRGTGSGR